MRNSQTLIAAVAASLTALISATAWSDDSEVLFGAGNSKPNIMMILDTSGSMSSLVAGSGGKTRMQVMVGAAKTLLNNTTDVNVGLMRYDTNAQGGMVMMPVQDIETARTPMTAALDALAPNGNTPLSETLYEAYLYFAGQKVKYGDTSVIGVGSKKSVAASRIGGVINNPAGTDYYDSPADSACQKNFIVYLTDGEPTSDTDANGLINGLSASDPVCANDSSNAAGACRLLNLSTYMFNNDLRSASVGGNPAVLNKQNVITNFIAFGGDASLAAFFSSLDAAAKAGTTDGSAGRAYQPNDAAALSDAFEQIFRDIKVGSSGVSATSVAVNSFNKTQILEDTYVSVFEPSKTLHWAGNVKKYKFRNNRIEGKNGAAVDTSTGFFTKTAEDFWSTNSTLPDYSAVSVGGAAAVIPAYGNRKVFTYFGTNGDLTNSVNAFDAGNTTNLTSSVLGIGGSGDPTRDNLINWARGKDVKNDDLDGATDNRHAMGESIHSQPAVVIYGSGSSRSDQLNDTVVFMATNDGYLHALDVATGEERWSFIPQEKLGELKTLYANAKVADTDPKHYGIDGDLRVLKYDINGNGTVDGNDKVYLYFSLGRGGENYYALDITQKDSPKLQWSLKGGSSSSSLIKMEQSWSPPTLARIKIADKSQNSQKLVLVFGGGYDKDEETGIGYQSSHDKGNAIHMVDAVTGAILWNASNSGAKLNLSLMDHAIPSSITVLDTNTDGFTDRMYVGDLAGQLWRFDIFNGKDADGSSSNALVTGGVIASLGGKIDSSNVNNRSFFNAPDVGKFIATGSANYYNIGIGSGDRSFPKSNATTQDRYYAIRDYFLRAMTQTEYNSIMSSQTFTKDADLITSNGTTLTSASGATIMAVPSDIKGLKVILPAGEKSLSPSITVDGVALFTTYTPNGSVAGSCDPSGGVARYYAINLTNGKKKFSNLSETVTTVGIPAQISIFNSGSVVCTGNGCSSSGSSPNSSASASASSSSSSSSSSEPTGSCRLGISVMANCVDFGDKVKTFWQQTGTD